jgi:hypothetical protein
MLFSKNSGIGYLRRMLFPKRKKEFEFSTEDTPERILAALGDDIKGSKTRIHLPTGFVMLPGALNCGRDKNHFSAAASNHIDGFSEFYQKHRPRCVSGLHLLAAEATADERLKPWELPWLSPSQSLPGAEQGLDLAHGVSFYGPISEEKLEVEVARVRKLAESIAGAGYKPDIYGDITGYFLFDGENYRFMVRGGKHRAAVLGHLEYEKIPVTLKRGWDPFIDRQAAESWPMVVSGRISAAAARMIFDQYFIEGGLYSAKIEAP